MLLKNVSLFVLLLLATNIFAQPVQQYDLARLAKENKLELFNRELTTASANKPGSIQLSAKPLDGVAWLKNVQFANGIVELDIKGKDVLQKSFVGLAFHGLNDSTYDAVYFRPFNFRSEDSVRRIHSVQYVAQPAYPWDRLRKEQNARFEKSVDPVPDPNDWFHVKIEIVYPLVKVYVNGSDKASLTVKQLSDRKAGKIGLMVGNDSDGGFANLSVEPKN